MSAEGAGDVNGDGFADILVTSKGRLSVVFGGRGSQPVDLDALGDRGSAWPWPIPAAADVEGVGDVNGDGRADLGIVLPASRFEHAAHVLFTGVARLLLSADHLALRPPRPVAGRAFTASFAVRRRDSARLVTGGRSTCDVSPSTEAVKLVATRVARGRAMCTWRVARAAAGMVVRGVVTFAAGRSAVERRFRIRVSTATR